MKTFDITYKTFDPTGNRTMLVTSPVERDDQAKAAGGILDRDRSLEQVAFVEGEGGSRRLQMMGGEFCGNATMSFASMLAAESGVDSLDTEVEVSGCDGKVPVHVEKDGEGWLGKVTMPLPNESKVKNFGRYKLPIVRFDGITHTIVTERLPKPLAEMLIREWANKIRGRFRDPADERGLHRDDAHRVREVHGYSGQREFLRQRHRRSGSLSCHGEERAGQSHHSTARRRTYRGSGCGGRESHEAHSGRTCHVRGRRTV